MEKKVINLDKIQTNLEALKNRSAWNNGVNDYAFDLVEELKAFAEYNNGGVELAAGVTRERFMEILLNGAKDWNQFSWGGCSLVLDCLIAERLCTPSELKKNKGGERNPNRYEQWLDVQALALFQASRRLWSVA